MHKGRNCSETGLGTVWPHPLSSLSVSSCGKGQGSSLIRGLLPFMGAPPHNLITPKVPPPNTITLGLYFNIGILWGHKPLIYGSVTSTAVYLLR